MRRICHNRQGISHVSSYGFTDHKENTENSCNSQLSLSSRRISETKVIDSEDAKRTIPIKDGIKNV